MLHSDGTEQEPTDSRTREVTRGLPYLPVAVSAAIALLIAVARGPIGDIDLYWHLLIGQEILDGTSVTSAGRGWSLAPVPDTWVSTQWLAEVAFARLYALHGLAAFPVYRTATTVVIMAMLALVTLYRRPARAGVWPFFLALVPLVITAQERSQQVTFILAPLVGWWGDRLWRQGRLPRSWVVLPLVVVWSNIHGGWVVIPLMFTVAGLARLIDYGPKDRIWWQAWLLAAGSLVTACMSPSGLGNVSAFVRFAGSGSHIAEWAHANPWSVEGAPLALMMIIIVVAWARSARRPSAGELVLVFALVVFGFEYWRNLTPAGLLLAPIMVGILARLMDLPDPLPRGLRQPWGRASLGLAAVGATCALALSVVQAPVVDASIPQRLLADLHATTAPQRVLTTYNLAGPVLWFAGPPPHVRVTIDGRADKYGADYIDRYMNALAGKPDWNDLVDKLAPTAALLSQDEPLGTLLVDERHWVVVGHEGGYQLLHAPDAPGW